MVAEFSGLYSSKIFIFNVNGYFAHWPKLYFDFYISDLNIIFSANRQASGHSFELVVCVSISCLNAFFCGEASETSNRVEVEASQILRSSLGEAFRAIFFRHFRKSSKKKSGFKMELFFCEK